VTSCVTVTLVAGGYCAMPDSLTAITRRAKSATALKFSTCGRLYVCDTLLEGLAQHLQDVAAELRPFIEEEHPMVRQRHFSRQRHLAATDQADIGDRVMGGTKGACRDDGGAVAGEAGDAMHPRGLQRFGETHHRQNSGQPARQHRLPHPRWPQEEDIMAERLHPIPLCIGISSEWQL
jgi:hypothetical protein